MQDYPSDGCQIDQRGHAVGNAKSGVELTHLRADIAVRVLCVCRAFQLMALIHDTLMVSPRKGPQSSGDGGELTVVQGPTRARLSKPDNAMPAITSNDRSLEAGTPYRYEVARQMEPVRTCKAKNGGNSRPCSVPNC